MSSANFSTRRDSVWAWSVGGKIRIKIGFLRAGGGVLAHGGECVEETGDVGHDAAFVWVGRVAEIFDFEELGDVEVFGGDLEGEASVAMSVALINM